MLRVDYSKGLSAVDGDPSLAIIRGGLIFYEPISNFPTENNIPKLYWFEIFQKIIFYLIFRGGSAL